MKIINKKHPCSLQVDNLDDIEEDDDSFDSQSDDSKSD